MNPTWDQTLIFPKVTLFGRAEELRHDPPVVIIEVFDQDLVVIVIFHFNKLFLLHALAKNRFESVLKPIYSSPLKPLSLFICQVLHKAAIDDE